MCNHNESTEGLGSQDEALDKAEDRSVSVTIREMLDLDTDTLNFVVRFLDRIAQNVSQNVDDDLPDPDDGVTTEGLTAKQNQLVGIAQGTTFLADAAGGLAFYSRMAQDDPDPFTGEELDEPAWGVSTTFTAKGEGPSAMSTEALLAALGLTDFFDPAQVQVINMDEMEGAL